MMRYITGLKARSVLRVLVGGALVTACSGVLDVENTNAIPEEDLNKAASAGNQANGVLAATVRALSGVRVPYSVATDELDWIGSRDAWLELERGQLGNYINEFTDGAFPFIAEARYLGDETIKRLRTFQANAELQDSSHLARSYLYTAIVYTTIADMYDDFAFSDKRDDKAPIGRAAMGTLYDKAVLMLDSALLIANGGTGTAYTGLRYPILAYRARVKHAKAVWTMLTPQSTAAPANPLVNNAGANADATAAMAVAGTTADQKFELVNNLEATAGINIWFEVNGRNEHAIGAAYGHRNATTNLTTGLRDTVMQQRDPTTMAAATRFTGFGTLSGTFTITSNRELRLILAESWLAQGNSANFRTELNAVRAMDSKTAWAGNNPATVDDNYMLRYERQSQLWLMGRRLSDLYRFGIKDTKWQPTPNFANAATATGLFFPIPNIERLANQCITTPTGAGC
jgi:starch-binding outer membrane protein, SusD/RagB family